MTMGSNITDSHIYSCTQISKVKISESPVSFFQLLHEAELRLDS